MADTIIISVDGEDGESGIQEDDLEDAAFDIQNDPLIGRNGRNAVKSLPGGPGGHLSVMVTQSSVVDGGISVDIISNGSLHQLPPVIEVAPNRIVRFSARGGAGQPGGIGGNGGDGMPGEDGVPATRTVDATNGSQGGTGGNAGAGSSGGDAGDGGTVEIQVPASMTHLLFAVEWDTRGGDGGIAGRHGRPGKGGPGGEGGEPCEWEEHLGYNFTCTPDCVGIGRDNRQMRRMLEWGKPSGELDLSRPQIVQGRSMNLLINSIASRHVGFSRQANAPMGTCRCAGGGGNCISCKRTELNTRMVRPKGKNGPPGERGQFAPPIKLLPGLNGNSGVGHIKVLHGNGTEDMYSARYRLELVSFDIQDENHDGIFEPGECIIIQRIRIKNSGGMPSPGCPIPITVLPSKWIEPLEDEEGEIFLSQSIPIGESVTLDGEFKAWIKTPEASVKVGTTFREEEAVQLKATMPWIDQTLDHFIFKKNIVIEYPLELVELNVLKSLVPSSRNKFAVGIRNKSSKTCGTSTTSRRKVEVTMMFPSDRGALLSRGMGWDNFNTKDVSVLAPKATTRSYQFIGVASSAEINSTAIIRVCLHLSLPESGNRGINEEWDAQENLQLIQQSDVTVKISPQYGYSDDASFLLITNPATPTQRIEATKNFVEDELKLKLDQWNLGQHGGFEYPPLSPEDEPRTIISSYAGKSIIFLGNDFDYFGQGPRNALQLCDIADIAQSSVEGTSNLFLGYGEQKDYNLLYSFVFPVNHPLQDPSTFIKDATHFTARKELLQAITQQQTVSGSQFTTYTLLVKPSLRGGKEESTRKEADSVVDDLRSQMPQERFLVSHIHPLSSIMDDITSVTGKGKLMKGERDFGLIVIYRGLPHSKSIRMTASHPIQHIRVPVPSDYESRRFSSLGQVMDRPTTKATLDPFDAYMVVSSLPLSDRISILFEAPNYPLFVKYACELSIIEDLCAEVSMLLDNAPILDSLSLKKFNDSDVLTIHFSRLSILLRHPTLKACHAIPDQILKILRYTLSAAYPTKKRHMISSQRTQVRNFLTKVIDEVLRRKGLEDSVDNFHAQAKKEAAKMQNELAKEISRLTRKTEQAYDKSWSDTGEAVKETRYCRSFDWDSRVREMEWARVERKRGLEMARNVLGEMTVL